MWYHVGLNMYLVCLVDMETILLTPIALFWTPQDPENPITGRNS